MQSNTNDKTLPGVAGSSWAKPGVVVNTGFDLAFFVLPPLGTFICLALQGFLPKLAFTISALIWVVLAQSHFGATLLFYLDRKSLTYYRSSPFTYFVLPVFMVLGITATGLTHWANSAVLIVPIVSFWHGNRQSVGVCGLYRGLTRSFDARARQIEQIAIFSGSACFTAAGIYRLNMFEHLGFSQSLMPPWIVPLWGLGLGVSFCLILACEWTAWKQCRETQVRPWMRMSVLFTSWAMYMPYMLAHDALSAYLTALIPHYMQYHGLLYLVNRNKLDAGVLGEATLLPEIVKSRGRYATATIGFALVLGVIVALSYHVGHSEMGIALVAGINLAHFWLDGFFWRFKDPQARAATLTYIRPLASA
jgi:hypothetical protein